MLKKLFSLIIINLGGLIFRGLLLTELLTHTVCQKENYQHTFFHYIKRI